MKSIYDVDQKSAEGEENFFQQFKGKVTLVVNTTVGCGNANQMEVLEWLQKKYKDRGFEVVALPTNDYCGPGVTKGKWSQGLVCGLDSQNYGRDVYGVTFSFSEKVNSAPNRDVVGELNGIGEPFGETSEIYELIGDHMQSLSNKATQLGLDILPYDKYYSWWLCRGFYGDNGQAANFEKYLVDSDGYVVKHYVPSVLNLDVEKTLRDNLLLEQNLPYPDAGAELSRNQRGIATDPETKNFVEKEIKIEEGGRIELAPDHILMVSHHQQQPPGPGHGRSYKIFEEEWDVVCGHIEELLNGGKSIINPSFDRVEAIA